jgi:hypothetical protein
MDGLVFFSKLSNFNTVFVNLGSKFNTLSTNGLIDAARFPGLKDSLSFDGSFGVIVVFEY